ncbi:MAG: Fic family protein [Gammaproteobacteria bacterium]|nr:MAG: Fic family protein [Gammaproteobacteria bacterium]
MKPPFDITPTILNQCLNIAQQIGVLQGLRYSTPPVELRRTNQLKGIQSSLAIEGNTLTLDDITAINHHQPIVAKPREVLEAKNALAVYKKLTHWQPYSMESFKKAHAMMMQDLIKEAGHWRTKNVGVYAGKQLTHMAPPAEKIPQLMRHLFEFLKAQDDISLLIKACVFHYEIEFIHPFMDGNGRIGRLWQQIILMCFNPIFEFIPVETLIKSHQDEYYDVLKTCDHIGNSTAFIEFSLTLIHQALRAFYDTISYQPKTAKDRLMTAQQAFSRKEFSRKEYSSLFKSISTATASRDLALGVQEGMLKKKGEKARTLYWFFDRN